MNNLNELIQNCKECQKDCLINEFITFEKPKLFYGSKSPNVLIIGHSPSVRTSEQAEYVLKLNEEDKPLFQYINKNVLIPLGLDKSNIFATNLIKCKTTELPEDIDDEFNFFETAFENCVKLLEIEINEINPELIISLSERVLKLISKKYFDKELKMKNSFGKLFYIQINNKSYSYIPIVHIPKGNNSLVAKHYFPEQTNRLISLKDNILHINYLKQKHLEIQSSDNLKFSDFKPSLIPEKEGVYCISLIENNKILYIGRTKNLRQRLYNNHLMGPLSNARLKKYLIDNNIVTDIDEAKKYILTNCQAKWIYENDYRKRGSLEGYLTGIMFPLYGIDEEH